VSSIVLFAYALESVRIVLPLVVYIFEFAAAFSMSLEAHKINGSPKSTRMFWRIFFESLEFGLYGMIAAYNWEINMKGDRFKSLVVEEIFKLVMTAMFLQNAFQLKPSLRDSWQVGSWCAYGTFFTCKLFRLFLTINKAMHVQNRKRRGTDLHIRGQHFERRTFLFPVLSSRNLGKKSKAYSSELHFPVGVNDVLSQQGLSPPNHSMSLTQQQMHIP